MNTKSTASVIHANRMAGCILTAGCLLVLTTVASWAAPDDARTEVGAETSDQSEDRAAVMQAYELRMAGKADEAQALLAQAISENPENGAAHYELARTLYHMALGEPRELDNVMGRAQQSIERATQADPEDVMHQVFAGHIAYMRGYFQMYALENESEAGEQFAKACGAYESALRLKPDYREAALYLVELYASLPENVGGDKAIAERYAKQLEGIDPISGAKASSILTGRDSAFWEGLRKEHAGDADVLEELGKAYLGEEKVEDAVACFEKAVDIDPEKAFLFLDLSIYHTFRGMRAERDSELFQTSVRSGDAAVARYIESEPVLPMLAYALGAQSKYKRHGLGDAELAQKLVERAKVMDPYFSKATGSPNPDLFAPPGKISHNHRYLLRPF